MSQTTSTDASSIPSATSNSTATKSGSMATSTAMPNNSFEFGSHMPLIGIVVALAVVVIMISCAWVVFSKKPCIWKRNAKSSTGLLAKPELDGTCVERHDRIEELGLESTVHEVDGGTWPHEMDATSLRAELEGDYRGLEEGRLEGQKAASSPDLKYVLSKHPMPTIREYSDSSQSSSRTASSASRK